MRDTVTFGWLLAALTVATFSFSNACSSRDCSEERAGQVRCVANRSELCNADGTLTYDSCATMGLVCSEEKGGCVTEDVLNSTGGGGAAPGGMGGATTSSSNGGAPAGPGAGGAGATGGAPGGMGGMGGTSGGNGGLGGN